jgi:hypothetical protein
LQPQGTSHSHLYLYREDGKFLRQLTNDNSGQESAPIFSPEGETIIFTCEKPKNVHEFWSVQPRGTNLKKLDTVPGWYTQAKSSPYFTNSEPEESAAATPSTSPTESASPSPTPPPKCKAPDDSVELILRENPKDEDDQIAGPGHGKHFALRDMKTGTETEFGKIPEFYGAFDILHDNQDSNRHFLFEGPLRIAFFGLHLNSTDRDTVLALDLNGPRFIRLSPKMGRTDSSTRRTGVPHVHGKSLRSHSGQQENGELLLHRALGRQAEPHSLCARKSAALCYGMSMYRPGLTPAVIILRRSSE